MFLIKYERALCKNMCRLPCFNIFYASMLLRQLLIEELSKTGLSGESSPGFILMFSPTILMVRSYFPFVTSQAVKCCR